MGYPSRVVAAWSREGVGKMVVDQLGAFVARQASNCLVVLLGVGLPMWTAVVALMLPKAEQGLARECLLKIGKS